MPSRTLIVLAELHFEVGLIGIDEFTERLEIARWLGDDSLADPRGMSESDNDDADSAREVRDADGGGPLTSTRESPLDDDDLTVEFVWLSWVFTRQDPDPYPSTPHGHLYDPNREWPKLNPYTGRVFKGKHQEDKKMRLTKKKLIELWRNGRFRDFCRSHVVWYREAHRHHAFGVLHPLRFPRPWK
jgi:hypothetical protein